MLDDLLRLEHLSYSERAVLRHALTCSSLWPADPELAAAARRHGFIEARPPQLGETLVVTTDADTSTAAQAIFRLHEVRRDSDRPLGPVARDTVDLARRLVVRDLPILVAPRALSRGTLSLERLFSRGGAALVEGDSLGLAALLAEASRLLARPVPSDLLATVALRSDGSLGPVGGLGCKINVVARSARGVRRLVVHSSQERDARDEIARLGVCLEVHAVHRASEAIQLVFPGVPMATSFPEPAHAARHLLRLVLDSSAPLLSWSSVAVAADRLASHPEVEPGLRWQLAAAARIARRHNGEGDITLDWPNDEQLETLHPNLRLQFLAHVVQSMADGGSDELSGAIERARRIAVAAGEHDAPLRLRGAIGRALAAQRRYDEAASVLEATVASWIEGHDAERASHSLCELVRVLGVLGRGADLARVRERFVGPFLDDPRTHPSSHAYLLFALGRAWASCGDSERDLVALEDPAVRWADVGLEAPRSRWRAVALARKGDAGVARALREAVGVEADRSLAGLLAIDQALEDGADEQLFARRVAEFLGANSQGTRWLAEGASTGREAAERVAREYPY